MKYFYLFLLFFFFSYPSLANINQPYGLFFIQEHELKEGNQIFEAPTLKTDIIVNVQGLISTTLVRQYFINPTKAHTEAVYLFPLPEKSAVDQLKQEGIPFVSVLTDSTTGGVSASLAMLGDIIIAEPGALIGFAGPRVIEQTVGTVLPDGFQKSEFLLNHGAIDMIVHRKDLRSSIAKLINLLYK